MKSIRSFIGVALIATLSLLTPAVQLSLHAQGTAVTQTTTAAAIGLADNFITVTSATGFTIGYYIYIDTESMKITSISGTTIGVQRSTYGTSNSAHANGQYLFMGPPAAFSQKDPLGQGPCTASANPYLPLINVNNGNRFACNSTTGTWDRSSMGGFPAFASAQLAAQGTSAMTYTTSGAIAATAGTNFLNGTTLAMTLSNPTQSLNGMIMTIISTNASAHTITYTAGFGGGTTTRDVATFGGAVNDNIVLQAVNGIWWVISTRNVTIA